jgi:hypothetical protein
LLAPDSILLPLLGLHTVGLLTFCWLRQEAVGGKRRGGVGWRLLDSAWALDNLLGRLLWKGVEKGLTGESESYTSQASAQRALEIMPRIIKKRRGLPLLLPLGRDIHLQIN